MTDLEKVIATMTAIGKSEYDIVVKQWGTWKKYFDAQKAVLDQIPPEGITSDGYLITAQEKDIWTAPKSAVIVGRKKSIHCNRINE